MVTASCGSKLYAHPVRGPGLGSRTCFGYSADHEIGLCFETYTASEGQHQLAEAILYCSVDIGHRRTRALEAQPSVIRVAHYCTVPPKDNTSYLKRHDRAAYI